MLNGFNQGWGNGSGYGFGYVWIFLTFIVELIILLIAKVLSKDNDPNLHKPSPARCLTENAGTPVVLQKETNKIELEFYSQIVLNNEKMKKESTNKDLPVAIQDPASLPGSILKKHPIVLDNGRTIIFISDKSREDEIRRKYEIHANHGNHDIHSESLDVPGNA